LAVARLQATGRHASCIIETRLAVASVNGAVDTKISADRFFWRNERRYSEKGDRDPAEESRQEFMKDAHDILL
jgi:hypothetical protein